MASRESRMMGSLWATCRTEAHQKSLSKEPATRGAARDMKKSSCRRSLDGRCMFGLLSWLVPSDVGLLEADEVISS